MRGRVLSFNDSSGRGLVSGEDSQRYPFMRASLEDGRRTILPGAVVDFVVTDGEATGIYPLPGAYGLADKNRIVAALLACPMLLGALGLHKFYLGKTRAGVIMLLMGTVGWLLVLPGLASFIIAFVEFVVYLIKSDQQFYDDYVVGNREWF